jgi:DNA (cytosine-5)-methyltransferase 1
MTSTQSKKNSGAPSLQEVKIPKNALVIPHDPALRVLLAAETGEGLSDEARTELPAVISHWLQSPKDPPILCPAAVGNRWERILRSYALREDTNPATPLKETATKKPFYIDFSGIPFPPLAKPNFTFIDLFAGIGGFRIALQNLGGKCLFSSEWDVYAKETYYKNYGEVPFGDIQKLSDKKLLHSQLDIIAGGFPCQPFSRAGVSARESLGQEHGFKCEEQGQLFFDVVKLAKIHQPKVILLENVGNIMSHDKGNTIRIIQDTIEKELGYTFHLKIYNAKTLVPQKRVRCIIVAFKDKPPKNWVMPELTGDPLPLRSILENISWDSKYTISPALWEGHQRRSKRNKDRGAGFTAYVRNLDEPSTTLVARYYKDGKECLIPQPEHPQEIPRMLTERECARLQGFPEQFIPHNSKARAYKQFGNAVPSPLIQTVAETFTGKL